MPLLMGLLGNWKLLALVGALVAGWFLLNRYEANIKEAVYQKYYAERVQQAMEAKEAELERVRKQAAADRAAVKRLGDQNRAIAENFAKLSERLKTLEDGPLAPVLREVVEE